MQTTEDIWGQWKKGFYAWENSTAQLVETWLRSPMVLGPSGAMMGALFKAKAAGDKAVAQYWQTLGVPSRRDQERTLHLINRLHTRINDLEEQLEDLSDAQSRSTAVSIQTATTLAASLEAQEKAAAANASKPAAKAEAEKSAASSEKKATKTKKSTAKKSAGSSKKTKPKAE